MVYDPTHLIRLTSIYFLFIYWTLAQEKAEGNGEEWGGTGKKAGERFVLTLQLRLAHKSQQTWVRVFHLQDSPLETLYLHSPAPSFSSSAMHNQISSQCSLSESLVLEGSTHLSILINKGIMVNKLPWCPGRRAVLARWEIAAFEKGKPSLEWKCHHSSQCLYKAKWMWLLNNSEACQDHLSTNNVCQGPSKCGFLLNAQILLSDIHLNQSRTKVQSQVLRSELGYCWEKKRKTFLPISLWM